MNSDKLKNIIKQGENETTEFKRRWNDKYLKTICAFANTNGGIMLIGIDDDKSVIGVKGFKIELELLPNKIKNNLGITVGISTIDLQSKIIIQVEITKSFAPISYHGKFFVRSGSVTTELKGGELNQFLLKKFGKT